MKLLHFTIVKLTFCLILGILIAHYLTIPLFPIIYCCLVVLTLLGIVLIISKNKFKKTIWFGLLTYLSMVCIGMMVVKTHNQKEFKNHYTNVKYIDTISSRLMTLKVCEVMKPTTYHDKYVVSIQKIGKQSVSGKLLLNIEKDSVFNPLKVDDIILSSASYTPINAPLNPYQFDYKNYLKKHYIYDQIFTENKALLIIASEPNSIFGFASIFRDKIDLKLKIYNFKPQDLAIIDALLLGQRKDINQDTYNNYVNAGVIHILAVSGLHVGIILYILTWLFKPLDRIKNGNYIRMISIAALLWCFAIIAGLSPSVSRAVTMFTIVAIGMNLKRPSNIYNTLAISMFFLLLFKPMFLFDIGFQMSYLAVLSIVSIQPVLVRLWSPKWSLLNYFWKLFTVTTAAQIGVVPISLYYFHQFPGLFFLSNLVILPFLGFILGSGIFIIVLALLNILPQFAADAFGFCISLMNNFVSWVAHQESFVFRNLSFGILFVVVSYLLIISIFAYAKKPNYSRLIVVLLTLLTVQGAFLFEKYRNQSNEFIVFHKSKFSLIGIKQKETLKVADNLDSLTKEKDNIIRNYKVGNSIKIIKDSELGSVYPLKEKTLLIVDSLSVYKLKSFKPDYVLLRNSPKVNLNRLIDSLQPILIIADGSNYKSYVAKWKATCKAQKIPFHQTSEKGAFIYKY